MPSASGGLTIFQRCLVLPFLDHVWSLVIILWETSLLIRLDIPVLD